MLSIMIRSVVLLLLVPAVFGRVAYDFNSQHEDITQDDIKEIQRLNELTQQLIESGTEFINPLQNVIEVLDDDVIFYVYDSENSEPSKVFLANAAEIAALSSFNSSLDTVFIIHGWHNNYKSNINVALRPAYLELLDINLIIVDWSSLAGGTYVAAHTAVPFVGQIVGQFIQNISVAYDYSLDKISLVGHSLGAHVTGFAGQETNKNLYSITGLDPAGPLYFKSHPEHRLSESDAQYVQSIHTNAGLLGITYSVAMADFWPNGGSSQPGCTNDLIGSCSHSRSYFYFAESLSSGDFVSKECDSYIDYIAKECMNISPTLMGGTYINTTITGNFYLQTNGSSPYALGGDTGY